MGIDIGILNSIHINESFLSTNATIISIFVGSVGAGLAAFISACDTQTILNIEAKGLTIELVNKFKFFFLWSMFLLFLTMFLILFIDDIDIRNNKSFVVLLTGVYLLINCIYWYKFYRIIELVLMLFKSMIEENYDKYSQ